MLFQELPAGRFEKATKTRFQFHKAVATIPNATRCKMRKILIIIMCFPNFNATRCFNEASRCFDGASCCFDDASRMREGLKEQREGLKV